jgi:hypothetical protein
MAIIAEAAAKHVDPRVEPAGTGNAGDPEVNVLSKKEDVAVVNSPPKDTNSTIMI